MTTCYICLLQINDNKLTTTCGHLYHSKCINLWLNINNICPVCRSANPILNFRKIDGVLKDKLLDDFIEHQKTLKSFDLADIKIYINEHVLLEGN